MEFLEKKDARGCELPYFWAPPRTLYSQASRWLIWHLKDLSLLRKWSGLVLPYRACLNPDIGLVVALWTLFSQLSANIRNRIMMPTLTATDQHRSRGPQCIKRRKEMEAEGLKGRHKTFTYRSHDCLQGKSKRMYKHSTNKSSKGFRIQDQHLKINSIPV